MAMPVYFQSRFAQSAKRYWGFSDPVRPSDARGITWLHGRRRDGIMIRALVNKAQGLGKANPA